MNTGMMDDKTIGERKIEEFKVFPTKADQQQFIDVIVSDSREQLGRKISARIRTAKIKTAPDDGRSLSLL